MKAISGKGMCRLLEDKDWFLLRVNGSHHIYGKAGYIEKISVPVHGQRSLKPGLQRQIMKITGISDAELREPPADYLPLKPGSCGNTFGAHNPMK